MEDGVVWAGAVGGGGGGDGVGGVVRAGPGKGAHVACRCRATPDDQAGWDTQASSVLGGGAGEK